MAHQNWSSRKRNIGAVVLLACVLIPTSLPAASAAVGQTMAARSEHNKQVVAAAFDRWTAGGSNFFTEMIAPEAVWTIEGSGPSAGTFRGRDALIRAIRPFTSRLSSPVRPTSRRLWADGDHVIVNWVGEATARDGRAYRNRYVWILKMAGGKAIEVNAFLDLQPYDEVLRRVPAPAASGRP